MARPLDHAQLHVPGDTVGGGDVASRHSCVYNTCIAIRYEDKLRRRGERESLHARKGSTRRGQCDGDVCVTLHLAVHVLKPSPRLRLSLHMLIGPQDVV